MFLYYSLKIVTHAMLAIAYEADRKILSIHYYASRVVTRTEVIEFAQPTLWDEACVALPMHRITYFFSIWNDFVDEITLRE